MKKKTEIDLTGAGGEGDKVNSADPGPGGAKLKKMKRPLIFGIAGLVFLCSSVGIAWQLGWIALPGSFHGKKSESPTPERSEIGPTVKLSPLTINLKEEGGRNYLKTTLVLEIGKKTWEEEIKSHMSTLTDTVILTLCDKRMEDLRRPESKEQIKQELLVKMNQYLHANMIKRIYFDEFLYQ